MSWLGALTSRHGWAAPASFISYGPFSTLETSIFDRLMLVFVIFFYRYLGRVDRQGQIILQTPAEIASSCPPLSLLLLCLSVALTCVIARYATVVPYFYRVAFQSVIDVLGG